MQNDRDDRSDGLRDRLDPRVDDLAAEFGGRLQQALPAFGFGLDESNGLGGRRADRTAAARSKKSACAARFQSQSIKACGPATNPPSVPTPLLRVPDADRNAVFDTLQFGHPPTAGTENPGGVRFIDDQDRVEPLGQIAKFRAAGPGRRPC